MPPKQTQQWDILYGIHPVTEALRAGRRRVTHIYLSPALRSSPLAASLETLKAPGTAVETLAPDLLTRLCANPRHQGVCARVSAFPATPLAHVLGRPPRTGRHRVLLALDCLTDPHNVGALLRTALVSGADGVLLPRRNTCGPTPAVSKISAGALEHSAVVPVANLVRTLDQLKAEHFWVFGLDRQGPQTLYTADFDVPMVLVIGGEHRGLRPLVKRHCDCLTRIPQLGPLDSLNASVAGAVALFEILRQQRAGKPP